MTDMKGIMCCNSFQLNPVAIFFFSGNMRRKIDHFSPLFWPPTYPLTTGLPSALCSLLTLEQIKVQIDFQSCAMSNLFHGQKNWNRPLAILTDFNLNFSARFVAFFSFSPIWYLRTPLVECRNQVWRTVVQFCSNLEEQSQSASGIAHFNFCPAIAIGRGVQSNICSE